MSQRDSGYERRELDLYETPAWVTRALIPHLPRSVSNIWEPACGSGKMLDELVACNVGDVFGTDISFGNDFFSEDLPVDTDAIITNPPYKTAREFIERSLRMLEEVDGMVAMLLRTDYDHAKTRGHLFRDCPAFAKKIVLTKRVVWFEGGASPSFNHAWFVWDWQHEGPPTIGYGP